MKTNVKSKFNWADPLMLSEQLSDDEREIGRASCRERVLASV